MNKPDILINNAAIVTVDENRTEYSSGFIAVRDGLIQAVGDQHDCPFDNAEKVIDATGKAALPGLINTHTHAIDVLLRGGLSDDRNLFDWLFNILHAGLAAYEQNDVDVAASLYSIESIRSGITTFVDNQDFVPERFDMVADTSIAAYKKFGMRVNYARMYIDLIPSNLDEYAEAILVKGPKNRLPFDTLETADEALIRIEELIQRHHGSADGRIQIWPSPGVGTMCTPEALHRGRDLAHKYNVMLTTHIAESPHDAQRAGMSIMEYLASIDFLKSDVLAAHCVQVDSNDIKLMSRHDVKVANNVISNKFLGSGIAPISDMITAGITVGIGTDNACCNNSINMLADMKTVALIQKAINHNAAAMTAEKVIEMATIDGAKAIGMQKEIGSLEIGKKADVILVDMMAPNMVPHHSVASTLVYQAYGSEVDTVMIDGRILMENRNLTMLEPSEENTITASAQKASEAIIERAGLQKMRDRSWF